jgi:F-type H+-transporting ATPase subunit gamma
MTRLTEIEGRVGSMRELLDLFAAMRSLAGMRMQEAQRTLPGIRRYAESLATAIGETLLLAEEPDSPSRSAPRGRLALILCAAEHGFVGGFNERLVDAAQAAVNTDDLLFVLGSRGAVLLFERGRPATWTHVMATRCSAAPAMVRYLSDELYRRIGLGEIARAEVVYARYRQGSVSTIERRLVLPLDTASLKARQPRQPPLHNLEPLVLREKLVGEYVSALLTEAAVESIGSENAARFAAMESAHDNVSKKLDRLRQEARQARQAEITNELIELAAGADAQGTK